MSEPCKCCGGLCPWHALPQAERPPFEPDIENDFYDAPGCWGCCGSGCRSCNNTGFISLDHAIEIACRYIETATKRIAKEKAKLSQLKIELQSLREKRESQ